MSSISSFLGALASRTIYSRISQSPDIQKISIGCSIISQIGFRALQAGIGFDNHVRDNLVNFTGAIVAISYGSMTSLAIALEEYSRRTWKWMPSYLKRELIFGQPPTMPSEKITDYESIFKRIFNQSISQNGNRELLYLMAHSDTDLGASFVPSKDSGPLSCLNKICDLTYKTIEHPLHICKEIALASSKNPVQDIAIGGHGSNAAVLLSPISLFRVFDWLPSNCFDGLSHKARIFLEACSTGEEVFWRPNLAQWISWLSGREVVAASDVASRYATDYFINPDDNRLSIRIANLEGGDKTRHFHISGSWMETASFHMKLIIPTILGAINCWQMARVGATLVQGSGILVEYFADKSVAPARKAAEKAGLYHPLTGKMLHTATKQTGKVLNVTGRGIHQGMDILVRPAGWLGSWALKKTVNVATSSSQRLYRGVIDSVSDFIMMGLYY
jgi:hypothetical protein